ncbi:hypothetical protein [Marilutibacter maris]|uniref:hypothetical protein n=1 Tax=Marilutibacter maris TaxID=1605891 RepID=UPI00167D934F|nr:hypothetical protein [Lysobacter maris]
MPFVGALFTRWISAAVLSGPGQLIAAAGPGWLSRIAPDASTAVLAGPLVVTGIGSRLP